MVLVLCSVLCVWVVVWLVKVGRDTRDNSSSGSVGMSCVLMGVVRRSEELSETSVMWYLKSGTSRRRVRREEGEGGRAAVSGAAYEDVLSYDKDDDNHMDDDNDDGDIELRSMEVADGSGEAGDTALGGVDWNELPQTRALLLVFDMWMSWTKRSCLNS